MYFISVLDSLYYCLTKLMTFFISFSSKLKNSESQIISQNLKRALETESKIVNNKNFLNNSLQLEGKFWKLQVIFDNCLGFSRI